jgi:flagellar assembly protein FliH
VSEALLARARVEAESLLAAARQEAEVLREEERARGLEEGRSEGRAELAAAAGRWQAAAEELASFKPRLLEEARGQVEELTLALVDRILGPLAEADAGAVARVAGRALQALADRETVTLRVNPDDLQDLLEAKPRLLQSFDGIKKLTVLEDHSVPRGGCLVETPTAEIDARLDTQLQDLARSLKKP